MAPKPGWSLSTKAPGGSKPAETISPPSFPEPTVSSDAEGVGLSSSHLLQSGRQMLDLVNRLHNTGVNVDIDLPLIAVIGQQSAGKSSLIESISGITLPRAAGTCTRCPTECRLSHSSKTWSCTVYIRLSKDGKTTNKQFGGVISSKSDVEDRIRRAQWAILNPSAMATHGIEYFLSGANHGDNPELSFSSNLVSLDISGPDVADLSFCDLPGLIAGVGQTGNTGDIDLVKSLVASYIKRPSCIILLTVACETDFQNQGAQELAKLHDPHGKRTVGVLTKPDRIPTGEENNWISLIRNEKEPLENGWFCVKQPSSAQISQGITWAQARQKEDEYFESTAVWQDLDLIYKKYLRTQNLVERLSSILSDLISKRLPEIQREINKTILTAQDVLNSLPKPPSSDPRNEIATLLHTFVWNLSKHIQGVPEKGILQAMRPIQETFRLAIRNTSPEFQPFYKRHGKRLQSAGFLASEESLSHHDIDDDERIIFIDEVMKRAEQARARELPGNYPYTVQEAYIKTFIKQWSAPAKILCQSAGHMLGDYVQNLVHDHFKSYGQGQLQQRVEVLMQEHLKKCMECTRERVEWLFKLEGGPFTLNEHYIEDYREKFMTLYRSAREKDRNPSLTTAIDDYSPSAPLPSTSGRVASPSGVGKVLAGFSEIGVHGIRPEHLANIIKKDGTESALFIMANVRAYFQVAYKRFVDNVPLAIDYELLQGLQRDVLEVLHSGLGINHPDGLRICQELAKESPKVSARREELSKKLERMYAASHELHRIGRQA